MALFRDFCVGRSIGILEIAALFLRFQSSARLELTQNDHPGMDTGEDDWKGLLYMLEFETIPMTRKVVGPHSPSVNVHVLVHVHGGSRVNIGGRG